MRSHRPWAYRRRRASGRVRLLGASALVALWLGPGEGARAEDRVSVRGVYFREASTRVIEPMVLLTKDLPEGFDVAGHYLLDAVTSASVAQGAVQDVVFTEHRHQAGLAAGRTFATRHGNTRVGGGFRYSREPDYRSGSLGVSVMQEVWQRTGTVAFNFAHSKDRFSNERAMVTNGLLDVWFGSLAYTQVLSPLAIAQVVYELSFLDGFQANPYLRTFGARPRVPDKRFRHVLGFKFARYLPAANLGVQAHYRFYYDRGALWGAGGDPNGDYDNPWGLLAHTAEGRVYWTFLDDFELRLSYRFHWQGSANFWCNLDPTRGGSTDCYEVRFGPGGGFDPARNLHSADVKYGSLRTHVPQVRLAWDLHWFRRVPLLRVFAPGTAEVSYGYFIQSSRYGNAHLAQVGYTLPF